MKNLLSGALLLASAGTACQSHAPATSSMAASASQAVAATAAPAVTDDSTAAVMALLRQVDLAAAWGNKTTNTKSYGAMDGFYGPDNYRIAFYFDQVRRDSVRPNVFHFQGRDRYKKVITPFTGTITVTRLASLPDTTSMIAGLHGPMPAYSAFASFELRESPQASGAGHCQGRAVLDFYVDQQQAELAISEVAQLADENPTEGCGLVFRGIWQDNRTGRRLPVSWANYYGVIMPSVLREMGLGSRSDEVNPRLARYGWNTLWENDEWWATSPKLNLGL